MPEATCCADKTHCCPSNLPVCDAASGRCLPPTMAAGGGAGAAAAAGVPWATKTPARVKRAAGGSGEAAAAAKAPAARAYNPAAFGDAKGAAARGRKVIRDAAALPPAS